MPASLAQLLASGASWQQLYADGMLGPFDTFAAAYENAKKQQPLLAKQYPLKEPAKLAPLTNTISDADLNKMMQANPGMTVEQAKFALSTMNPVPGLDNPAAQQAINSARANNLGVPAYIPQGTPNPLDVVKPPELSFPEKPAATTEPQGPITPVRGVNESGEETITFTAQGMKRFLTLMNPAQDGRLSGIDPNSNIGINPYAMKAPLTPEQAAQTDPAKNLLINANATPLPEDVLAQLRMDKQQQQQAGSYQPASLLAR